MSITKIKKMSVEELQNAIDKATGMQTLSSYANKTQLINKYIDLLNKGLIK